MDPDDIASCSPRNFLGGGCRAETPWSQYRFISNYTIYNILDKLEGGGGLLGMVSSRCSKKVLSFINF